jgi:hypothetical protein
MFTSVETTKPIHIWANEVGGGKGEIVRDFLNVVMMNNYFNYIGNVWKMSEYGIAQGTPLLRALHNLSE